MSFVSSVTKDTFSIWLNTHTEEGEKIAELAVISAQTRAKVSNIVERKKKLNMTAKTVLANIITPS